MIWRYHTPERDGHAPDDWDGGPVECRFYRTHGDFARVWEPRWQEHTEYRYRPLQDATVETSFDTLKAQCLALPEEERSALVEALQEAEIDWTNDVWLLANAAWEEGPTAAEGLRKVKQVIRSMCRPREVEVDAEIVRKIANQWGIHPTTVEHIISEALS